MAEENRGGPRQPDGKPRPPSGPGKYSQRTDLSRVVPTGQEYGARAPQEAALAEFPLPTSSSSAAQPSPVGAPAPGLNPLDLASLLIRPTNRPDEPVTAGMESGPGPGPEALGPTDIDAIYHQRLIQNFTRPDSPPELRGMANLYKFLSMVRQPAEVFPLEPEDYAS